ncbi:hypothetical protein KC614_02315 [candidate division WWE3 bacterium]|uniref:Uncharacterized protein n=1 Tax=candidate division WWE3 bacterium TaxID=2053526 RepID=A0A955LLF2_UNCKA|nr:hypothetical protein [candidate division WWE3 bacterium]
MLQVFLRALVVSTAIIITAGANISINKGNTVPEVAGDVVVSEEIDGLILEEPAFINEEQDRVPLQERLVDPADDAEGQILPEAAQLDLSLMLN